MLGKYPGMPALFTYGITKTRGETVAQQTNKKAGQYQNKTNTSSKKNTQTKTRAATRKPRDQEVHKQRQSNCSYFIICIFRFLGCLVCIQEKALGHGCIMRF